MAETIPEYVDPLLRRQDSWSNILGSSVLATGPETYAINASIVALIAVVMKAMVDKGVITDAEWLQRLDAVTTPDQHWENYQWILQHLPPPL